MRSSFLSLICLLHVAFSRRPVNENPTRRQTITLDAQGSSFLDGGDSNSSWQPVAVVSQPARAPARLPSTVAMHGKGPTTRLEFEKAAVGSWMYHRSDQDGQGHTQLEARVFTISLRQERLMFAERGGGRGELVWQGGVKGMFWEGKIKVGAIRVYLGSDGKSLVTQFLKQGRETTPLFESDSEKERKLWNRAPFVYARKVILCMPAPENQQAGVSSLVPMVTKVSSLVPMVTKQESIASESDDSDSNCSSDCSSDCSDDVGQDVQRYGLGCEMFIRAGQWMRSSGNPWLMAALGFMDADYYTSMLQGSIKCLGRTVKHAAHDISYWVGGVFTIASALYSVFDTLSAFCEDRLRTCAGVVSLNWLLFALISLAFLFWPAVMSAALMHLSIVLSAGFLNTFFMNLVFIMAGRVISVICEFTDTYNDGEGVSIGRSIVKIVAAAASALTASTSLITPLIDDEGGAIAMICDEMVKVVTVYYGDKVEPFASKMGNYLGERIQEWLRIPAVRDKLQIVKDTTKTVIRSVREYTIGVRDFLLGSQWQIKKNKCYRVMLFDEDDPSHEFYSDGWIVDNKGEDGRWRWLPSTPNLIGADRYVTLDLQWDVDAWEVPHHRCGFEFGTRITTGIGPAKNQVKTDSLIGSSDHSMFHLKSLHDEATNEVNIALTSFSLRARAQSGEVLANHLKIVDSGRLETLSKVDTPIQVECYPRDYKHKKCANCCSPICCPEDTDISQELKGEAEAVVQKISKLSTFDGVEKQNWGGGDDLLRSPYTSEAAGKVRYRTDLMRNLYSVGDSVVISGLPSRVDLEGVVGRVLVAPSPADDRVAIGLATGEQLKIKHCNLKASFVSL